jgi:phage pi2 protein 07
MNFKPGTEENCLIAQQNYKMCIEHGLVTPVWECPKFCKAIRVYMICPCRHASEETKASIDAYVEQLEARGCIVHYPPRDVEQDEASTTAHEIMQAHVKAMSEVDEVHAWWDPDSKGSHVDFGMAYMMRFISGGWDPIFVLANDPESTAERSFGNYFRELCGCNPSRQAF